ncbi:MAG TPA: hypothetical protein VMG82_29590 [Candidatus Sulfotelmatobacter sp.]|nr:hypothetical protein [Candidatus Sulfotelmatobacter sp.]
MDCIICGQPIDGGRPGAPPTEAKYCSKCRADRRRRAKLKYTWRPEFDDILKAQYYGGLNRRFQVLNRMIRMTGLPRWYIKRRAARLGLSMKMDRKPWTPAELTILEKLVGRVSSATIAKRLHRPESSVVNKLKRLGNSRRVREGYTMRDLEQCLGEDHHKISAWIASGWLRNRLQGTRRHGGSGNDIHRIREKDILEFLKHHPQEINLGKVDQVWFLDLVLLRGREVPEAKTLHREVAGEDSAAA